MKKLRSNLISKIYRRVDVTRLIGVLFVLQLAWPGYGFGKIYIDINAPSQQEINVAIPDFQDFSQQKLHPELAASLPAVITNDLGLSGYFNPMEKKAFLEENSSTGFENIRFKDWSVIGTELLLKGAYTTIGRSMEVEVRLFDVFSGRQMLRKRFLGKIGELRELMHRVSNMIILELTGYQGLFLSKIAFIGTSTGQKEVYLSDYDGHNPRMITSDKSIALFPRWSPKGDKIIYSSYKDGGPMLYMKDLKTGVVKKISSRKGLNVGATWAPDGDSLALTLSHQGGPDIYLIKPDGKSIKRVSHHWGIDVSPTFSPDGEKIAYVSNRSGSPQIYVRDLAGGRDERITFEGNYNTSPVWSHTNRIAYAGMNDGGFDIFTINPDGSNSKALTRDSGNNEDPWWSPDGRYLVFSSNREGRYHLYLMNANGGNQKKITTFEGEQTSPSWSPF